MKHTKIYSCLFAVLMILMASANAMAQELTVKTVSFLKPGEKATLAVGLKNAGEVDAFQAKVTLPEGLTFVDTEEPKHFAIQETERTKDWTLVLQKSNEKTAILFGLGGDAIAAGEGDIVTFDVNVADDYTGTKMIALSNSQIGIPGAPAVKPEGVVEGKICSTEDQMFVSAAVEPITVGTPQAVTFSLDFDKAKMNSAAFQIVLPAGLTLVDGSAEVGSICLNNEASYNEENGMFVVIAKNVMKDATFAETKGDFASFQVQADETFVDGSEILIKNVHACSVVDGNTDEYYAEDFTIPVKLVTTGINGIDADKFAEAADGIYQLNGVRTDKLQRGVNIVVKDGKAVKVVKK